MPVFRPKRLKNHTLWGGTYLYSLYRGVPSPREIGVEIVAFAIRGPVYLQFSSDHPDSECVYVNIDSSINLNKKNNVD